MGTLQQTSIDPSTDDPPADKWPAPNEEDTQEDDALYANPEKPKSDEESVNPNTISAQHDAASHPSNPTQQSPQPPYDNSSYLQSQSNPQNQQPQYNPRVSGGNVRTTGNSDPSSTSKIFVGGLSWETDEDSLRRYFETIGTVLDCVIMRDRHTGHPRGFGFVTFAEEESAVAAASRRHDLDGRQVEAKRAVPRNESNQATAIGGNVASGLGSGGLASGGAHSAGGMYGRQASQVSRISSSDSGVVGGGNTSSSGHRGHHSTRCKVFVGGLPSGCGVDEFRSYFSQFGEVVDAQVMIDHNTGNSRGFGFVTFANESIVNAVVGQGKSNTDHEIMGKCVEVKRAEPKGPPNDRRNSHRNDNYSTGGVSGSGAGGGGGGSGGGGLRGSAGGNDGGLRTNAVSNGVATNAAAAAAAAYYSNYPTSLAEQYGAYYNNPQWQQYFAAMGFNFNHYPQGFTPYQQYLQAYMNNTNAASGGGGGAAASSGAGNVSLPINGNSGGAGVSGDGGTPGGGGVGSGGMFLFFLSSDYCVVFSAILQHSVFIVCLNVILTIFSNMLLCFLLLVLHGWYID